MSENPSASSDGYLLIVHLGPVQDWIAQARRTRDSWFGSHYLSEVSKAAALALLEQDAQLIFPYNKDKKALRTALRPCDTPWYEKYYGVQEDERKLMDKPAFNVANKIVAVVQGDPRAMARSVREAAIRRWRGIVDTTLSRKRCRVLIRPGTETLIAEQRDTLQEFYAVWAPLQPGNYAEVFNSLNRALNARKELREFKPWTEDKGGFYRSSLDGARSSILVHPKKKDEVGGREQTLRRARARLRIGNGEHLDAVGLTKRAGGGPEQFIPLVNVARADWIRKAASQCPTELASLRAACEDLINQEKGDLGRVWRPTEWVKSFPYDAHLLSEERWEILLEEMKEAAELDAPIQQRSSLGPWADTKVRPVLRKMPPLPSYVACIIADGDRMGDTLKLLTLPQQHQIFSEELSHFASEARDIVEIDHHGSLVFSGGDDVFGWVPVSQAVACADALRQTFSKIMGVAVSKAMKLVQSGMSSTPVTPTLSVGVGIGHVMESMGSLINLAREAEKLAKGNGLPDVERRSALAILVDKRSGGRLQWRVKWDASPRECLSRDIDLLINGGLSLGKVHELSAMVRSLPEADKTPSEHLLSMANVLAHEVRRILGRNAGRGGTGEIPITPRDLDLDLKVGSYAELRRRVETTVTRVLIAQELREPPDKVAPGDKLGGSSDGGGL